VRDEDLCPMSDLPPEQCALPCHRNESLPPGVDPEVVRGVQPVGRRHALTAPAAEQHETQEVRPHARRPRVKPTDCRHDEATGEWLTREHVRDCDSHACEGCKPCPQDHCALFGSCPNHVNADVGIITCPAHIGEARGVVADIVELAVLVDAELVHASVGSEVATVAGPVADVDQLDARRDFIGRGYDSRGWCDWPRLPLFDDVRHPVSVFARWERDLRREYEQPDVDHDDAVWPRAHVEQRHMLAQTADYFHRMLKDRFPHDEPFENFLRDMRQLRGYLEEILSDSRRPDMGVPCPKCVAALEGTDVKAPRLTKRHADADRTGASDRWVCPDYPDDHWWREADYRLRVAGDYLAHADRLTADQMAQQYGIPAGTIRRWANVTRRLVDGEWVESPASIRPAGRTPNGVRLYDVREVLNLRDQTHPRDPDHERTSG
jgi:hypothetical protein